MSLMAFWLIKAANTFNTHYNDQVYDQLPDLQDQKSLRLCWRSVSELGRECAAFSFSNKGSLDVSYECLRPIAMLIHHDVSPNIVDALLTHIFRMRKGVYRFLFWL